MFEHILRLPVVVCHHIADGWNITTDSVEQNRFKIQIFTNEQIKKFNPKN